MFFSSDVCKFWCQSDAFGIVDTIPKLIREIYKGEQCFMICEMNCEHILINAKSL